MRFNVHPVPIGQFDVHLPWKFYCRYSGQDYAQPFIKLQQAGVTDVTLVNNGEPPARLQAVQFYLAQHGIEPTIEIPPDRYNKPDLIFNGQGYATVPGAIPGCRELIDYYLAVYHELDENVNQLRNLDVFYGFKKANPLHWYHYGLAMPETKCPLHLHIRDMYDSVFWSYTTILSNFLGYDKQEVAERLILRINHTSPEKHRDPVNRVFLPQHWDTAVMTGNLYTTHPGLNIQVNGQMVAVEEFYDQQKETLVIPGIDYCDEFETMTGPTWHEVVDRCDNQERASIVALLKRRRFRE